MGTLFARSVAHACAVTMIAIAIAAPVRAQDETGRRPPPAAKPPPNDPRRGPRLAYSRGPAACLPEADFRDEVAIILDGVDHFAATSPDEVALKNEKNPGGGYRATLVYTNAQGRAEPPVVKTYYNCEILGRWIAGTASGYIPGKPKEAPPPPAALPDVPECEVRPACDKGGGPLLAAWGPPPAMPMNFGAFEVVAPPLTFLERLRKMNLTIALGASALLGVGVAENVNGGFDLGAEIRGEIFSVGVGFRGMPPSKVHARERIDPIQSYQIVEGDLSEWTGLLVPCARYKWFVGCAVAQGGLMEWLPFPSVRGETTYAVDGPVLNFGPRIGFEIPIGDRFGVFGFGEALFRAIVPHVDFISSDNPAFDPANTRWTASPAVGVFSVGLVVKLN